MLPITKHRNLPLGSHRGPPVVSGEGHTAPERVGPHGADNAANLVLACLPCAQADLRLGGAPYQKNGHTFFLQYLPGTQLVNLSCQRPASHFFVYFD